MGLTRDDLENDSLRAALEQTQHGLPLLSRDAFEASLKTILAARTPDADVWVFAYGSLIWNPLLQTIASKPATLHGFHRRYCLWSRAGRGTPEQPGLMLGLDNGGSCRGVAFCIAAGVAEHELRLLWRREMVMGSYVPRWVNVRLNESDRDSDGDFGDETVRAIAFVVNHSHPHYAGKLQVDTMVEAISGACGRLGPCADYLVNTVAGLDQHGIHDRALAHLHRLVVEACNKKR
jgi:glutathione-specific gamma-glutamylcyclotransferase